jgi:hypothetical protein
MPPLNILDQFSFEELQRLHRIAARLQEAALVVKLNIGVVSDLRDYYKNLTYAAGFAEEIKTGCTEALHSFFQRVENVMKDLEMEHNRIESLTLLLDDGKALVRGLISLFSLSTQATNGDMSV